MGQKRETEGDYDMMCVGDVRARNSTAEALPFKQANEGSNPSEPTKLKPEDRLWVEILKDDVKGEDEAVARTRLRESGFRQAVIDEVFEKHDGLMKRLAQE